MKKTITVRGRLAQGFAISSVIALASAWALQPIEAQIPQLSPQDATGAIESLSAPGQRLLIRSVSKTGLVTFASSRDGIELPLQASVTAEERALSFVDLYGAAFGLADRSQLQRIEAPKADDLGITHARFQQVYQGIPIRAAEFFVHMKGTRVMSANGRVIDDLPVDLTPAVAPAAALDAARTIVEKYRPSEAHGAQYLTPRLEIFNKGVLADGTYPSRLAWFVEATNLGAARVHLDRCAHRRQPPEFQPAAAREVAFRLHGEWHQYAARHPSAFRGRAGRRRRRCGQRLPLRRHHLRLLSLGLTGATASTTRAAR